jgi:mRNA-degrading endonuclease RelE of RelBE toxin-antitoxin system
MESYEIEFQPSVRKDFRKLSPDNASRILPRIEELAKDHFPPQSYRPYPIQKILDLTSTYPKFPLKLEQHQNHCIDPECYIF